MASAGIVDWDEIDREEEEEWKEKNEIPAPHRFDDMTPWACSHHASCVGLFHIEAESLLLEGSDDPTMQRLGKKLRWKLEELSEILDAIEKEKK